MDPNRIDRRSVEDAAREASERPLDFDPAERATMLRAMVRDLVPLVRQGKLEAELKEAYPIYADRYPELFKKIVTKQDLTPLNTMIAMLDKMAAGSISQHEASIIVGQRLIDRFVKPQLNGSSSNRQGH
jgi:hypothetical protein